MCELRPQFSDKILPWNFVQDFVLIKLTAGMQPLAVVAVIETKKLFFLPNSVTRLGDISSSGKNGFVFM
jgi:hypothetical protein